MPAPRHVVLIGLMASGKSTVGRLLAARLGRSFVDNDKLLEARTGRTAREIEEAAGAGALHRREAEVLVAALADPEPRVIAAAAAAPMEAAAAAALEGHDVVYLRATPAVLAARLARAPSGDEHRPFVSRSGIADAHAVLSEQFDERDERYRGLATVIVEAVVGGPQHIADEISAALER